jgi:hypothetical protein
MMAEAMSLWAAIVTNRTGNDWKFKPVGKCALKMQMTKYLKPVVMK